MTDRNYVSEARLMLGLGGFFLALIPGIWLFTWGAAGEGEAAAFINSTHPWVLGALAIGSGVAAWLLLKKAAR